MKTIKLSSKGQVVLPAAIRAANAWPTGTEFELIEMAEGLMLKPLARPNPFAPSRLQEVFGMAGYRGPALTVEDMHAAVQSEAARRR